MCALLWNEPARQINWQYNTHTAIKKARYDLISVMVTPLVNLCSTTLCSLSEPHSTAVILNLVNDSTRRKKVRDWGNLGESMNILIYQWNGSYTTLTHQSQQATFSGYQRWAKESLFNDCGNTPPTGLRPTLCVQIVSQINEIHVDNERNNAGLNIFGKSDAGEISGIENLNALRLQQKSRWH